MSRILTINPGSTSTKIAVFDDEAEQLRSTLDHEAADLQGYPTLSAQLPYRRQAIDTALVAARLDLSSLDGVSGRGGGLVSLPGGTYLVNERMLEHARSGSIAVHPAALGCQLAAEYATRLGIPAFIVDPPDVDELADVARITGLATVVRQSRCHALNQKAVARKHAASLGRDYQKLDLVVAHLGGGISVAAHRSGRIVDTTDVLNGDGPMAPTRCGALPVRDVVDLCFSGRWDATGLNALTSRTGGFVDHLGTADAREVARRAAAGDEHARLVYQAMIYQVGKAIAGCVAVLGGRVDAILLTGGIAHDTHVVEGLTAMVATMGPVVVYPGELEMEALAAGAQRVLAGIEPALEYTGTSVFPGFPWSTRP